MMLTLMFRDTGKLPFFPDCLKLDSQNTRKLVRINKKKKKNQNQTNKPSKPQTRSPHKTMSSHKTTNKKKKTPSSPIIFFLCSTPNWLVAI